METFGTAVFCMQSELLLSLPRRGFSRWFVNNRRLLWNAFPKLTVFETDVVESFHEVQEMSVLGQVLVLGVIL